MLATTADELLTLFRAEISDQATPPLFPDAECYAWMTEACDSVLKQADAVYSLVTVPVTAGDRVVPLRSNILHIRHARLVTVNRTVQQANLNDPGFAEVDDYGLRTRGTSELFDSSMGVPLAYVRDYAQRSLRLVPAPANDDTLELQCTTTIGFPMESGLPLPSLDTEDQRLFLHFMKMRAYQKHDAETEDLVRARYYEAAFRDGVLERASRLRNYRRTPGVIRMDW